jgi:hypothetical protein
VAEHALALAPVVAGIVVGGEVMVDRLIDLDAPFLDVLFEQIVDAQKLDTLIGKPILQTKPGRIVGVASFG